MNVSHVIKIYEHKTGVKTTFHIAETVQLLELVPKPLLLGPGRSPNAIPLDST